ncbi:helix-turn-helix domain-containing protein [Herbiconiux liangxiaofengii]|uniref:helix-turn-helix domain-containing protein n=1 Tax=Herbiconiux liangxiaofengii TaxID=3342795 RepID=UPI0035B9D75B
MSSVTQSTSSASKAHTYLPDASSQGEIVDFANTLRQLETYLSAGLGRAALIDPAGVLRSIPDEIFRALEQVANALANGNGVTVAPYGMQLTTQEAADFLGISRPTLVKLLESGQIPFELRGRHRRVTLRDIVDYQARFRVERRSSLDELARAGQGAVPTERGVPELDRMHGDESA